MSPRSPARPTGCRPIFRISTATSDALLERSDGPHRPRGHRGFSRAERQRMTRHFDTILLTGAAGRLGTVLRRGLAPLARRLRLARPRRDRRPAAERGERWSATSPTCRRCSRRREGVDAIVHFGGAPLEVAWEDDPQLQHPRQLQHLRGRPEERRAPRDLRLLRPCDRLSHAGRPYRCRGAASAGQPLRPVEMLRRGSRPALLGQVRDRERLPAHLLVLPRAGRSAHALVLAVLRRLRAAGDREPDGAARRASRSSSACPTTR